MPSTLPGLGPRPAEAARAASRIIVGGVVAHNDERRIEASLRSLLSQELPSGVRWGRVWVVASGCTDRTVEIARAVAEEDPRVSVVVEAERRGKAAAIRQVLSRAEGDLLVLLNSDAVAAPGAVGSLLTKATSRVHPFAVMARPVTSTTPDDDWGSTMRWMWELHHELHLEMLENGEGAHLSDELLLVSLPAEPWIEDGVINDGSYCAVWLRAHSGTCWYAPEARVFIDVPRSRADHLRQRRRIHVGNSQVTARLGQAPTTALRFFFEQPSRAVRAVRRALAHEGGLRHLVRVLGLELAAHSLAAWDHVPPRRDHVRWSRISSPPGRTPSHFDVSGPASSPALENHRTEGRVRVLLDVAQGFGTGVPLAELASLLPAPNPVSSSELEEFLAQRPGLAQLRGRRVYGTRELPPPDPQRTERGLRYARAAETFVHGPLNWLTPWIRCIGVTGSTAYGEPREGDDIDFYVVTRSGGAAGFLFATYLTLRLRRRSTPRQPPATPCFNYVVDDRRAPVEFAHGRGLLFAREALAARLLLGDEYYRGLLLSAPWLSGELPSLYARRAEGGGDVRAQPAPFPVRLLSALVFLPFAGYLQAVGLLRNARSRRQGRTSEIFRTVTLPNRFAFQSQRFEELRERYDRAPEPTSVPATTGVPSRIPLLR